MITKLISNAIKPHIEELTERIDRANEHNRVSIRGAFRGIEHALHRIMSIRASDIANEIDVSTIGDTMNNYEFKMDNRIKEMGYLKINNISMVENIDYIILDDRKTIRFISDKAKKVCDLFKNQDIIDADYKEVDYKNTYHTLYSNISKLLLENRQSNWSPDILLMKWDNIRMHVSYIGDK